MAGVRSFVTVGAAWLSVKRAQDAGLDWAMVRDLDDGLTPGRAPVREGATGGQRAAGAGLGVDRYGAPAGRGTAVGGYRSCLGILRLERRYGRARLEAACSRAVCVRARSFEHLRSILQKDDKMVRSRDRSRDLGSPS